MDTSTTTVIDLWKIEGVSIISVSVGRTVLKIIRTDLSVKQEHDDKNRKKQLGIFDNLVFVSVVKVNVLDQISVIHRTMWGS